MLRIIWKEFSRKWSDCKESACNEGDLGSTLCFEDPLGKGMATHSSILAWRIPWIVEPGELQSVHEVTKIWLQLSNFHFSLSKIVYVIHIMWYFTYFMLLT